jgi:AcrR family transcriptional regulator
MGLREVKAERTRKRIVDVAIELFLSQGFDETTMEQIAEHAEVGSTTLYRYFPSKDLLALDPLNTGLELGNALRRRPLSEPLAESLGAVVIDTLGVDIGEFDRFAALRRIVDSAPGPRAKLWDLLAQALDNLTGALAERMGRDESSLEVAFTSRIVFTVWELAWERWWATDHSLSREAMADELLTEINRMQLTLPISPGPTHVATGSPVADVPVSRLA